MRKVTVGELRAWNSYLGKSQQAQSVQRNLNMHPPVRGEEALGLSSVSLYLVLFLCPLGSSAGPWASAPHAEGTGG